MSIRKYAESVGHKIVGKLTRHPECEFENDWVNGGKKRVSDRCYFDDGGNEYWVGEKGVCIVTVDGGVI